MHRVVFITAGGAGASTALSDANGVQGDPIWAVRRSPGWPNLRLLCQPPMEIDGRRCYRNSEIADLLSMINSRRPHAHSEGAALPTPVVRLVRHGRDNGVSRAADDRRISRLVRIRRRRIVVWY